jgi:threonine/homoserine/homoserine lactone efflux protein
MTIGDAVLGFAIVAALLTIIPGLDTALVLRSSLTRSRGYAFATALGIQTGIMAWGIAAAVGATALLAVSEFAYSLVTIAGALYLIGLGLWLGVKSFRHPDAATAPELPPARGGWASGWAMGVLTNLLNPKVGVFYIATIPQFVPAGVSPLPMGALLAAVHCVLGMVWFTAIILGGSAIAPRLRSTRFIRWIDRITGAVLIAFGVKLLVEARA